MDDLIRFAETLSKNPGLVSAIVVLVVYQITKLFVSGGNSLVAETNARTRRETIFNDMVVKQGRELEAVKGQMVTLTDTVEHWKKSSVELAEENRELREEKKKVEQRVTDLEAEVDRLLIANGLPPKYAKAAAPVENTDHE